MPHFYNPCDNMIWTQTGPYPQYMLTPSFPPRQDAFEQQAHQQQGFEQHTKVVELNNGKFLTSYETHLYRTAQEAGGIVDTPSIIDRLPSSLRCLHYLTCEHQLR